MEKEKVANKVVEEMMNHIKELFQKSVEELALEDEEMLEGQIYEEIHQEDPDDEDPDETFDEDEVLISSLPFDEDIQAFVPPAHQEENMMSCNPFEDLDDTLFHDFGNEEVLEEPLDAIDPFWKRKTKHSVLRIKPLVMKRRWRGMSIKRKKNSDESQHVETSLSLLRLMKVRLSNLAFLLCMKLKKQLVSMMKKLKIQLKPP
jgi:hypothetical protein